MPDPARARGRPPSREQSRAPGPRKEEGLRGARWPGGGGAGAAAARPAGAAVSTEEVRRGAGGGALGGGPRGRGRPALRVAASRVGANAPQAPRSCTICPRRRPALPQWKGLLPGCLPRWAVSGIPVQSLPARKFFNLAESTPRPCSSPAFWVEPCRRGIRGRAARRRLCPCVPGGVDEPPSTPSPAPRRKAHGTPGAACVFYFMKHGSVQS